MRGDHDLEQLADAGAGERGAHVGLQRRGVRRPAVVLAARRAGFKPAPTTLPAARIITDQDMKKPP